VAHLLLQVIRQRYDYRCGYCGVSEIDTGGELTIDHYIPFAHGGTDEEDNLVYACPRCNGYKWKFLPTEAHQAIGQRILHPLNDNLAEHYRLDEITGELIGLTVTGRFHITQLKLNRSQLKVWRIRNLLVRDNFTELKYLREQSLRQAERIERLEKQIRGDIS